MSDEIAMKKTAALIDRLEIIVVMATYALNKSGVKEVTPDIQAILDHAGKALAIVDGMAAQTPER